LPPVSLAARNEKLAALAQQYADVFAANGITALAFPTIPVPATPINPNGPAVGQKAQVNGQWFDEIEVLIPNLFWGPRLGAPGISLPAGLTAALPVGLSLQGLPGDDSRLVGLGIAVENALGRIPAPTFARGVA
jgi:mandelamide amidase